MHPETDSIEAFRVFAEDRLKVYLEKPATRGGAGTSTKTMQGNHNRAVDQRLILFEKELKDKAGDLSYNQLDAGNRLNDMRAVYVDILRNSSAEI